VLRIIRSGEGRHGVCGDFDVVPRLLQQFPQTV